MPKCSVCTHPERERIDESIRSGEPERTIANRFGVSKASIHRHKHKHLNESASAQRDATHQDSSGSTPELPCLDVSGDGWVDGTPKREKAVVALLTEPSMGAAAEKAGISPRTLSRWIRDDCEFRSLLRSTRKAVFQRATTYLVNTTVEATETLLSVMRDEAAPASARVSASQTCLRLAVSVFGTDEIEERIELLERAVRRRNHEGR